MSLTRDGRPDSPPEPTHYPYPVACALCGTEIPAGDDVYRHGGETECWGECAP